MTANAVQWLNKGLIGEPALMLGLIALIGLLLQKQPLQKLLSGTIKTMLGVKLVQIGANETGASLSNMSAVIQNGFQIIGIIPHSETTTAMTQINFGEEMALIMLIGMIVHLAIARFTPAKYIFMAGHHMLFMSALLAALLMSSNFSTLQTMLIGGTVLAVCMSSAPLIAQPYARKVIGNNSFGLGHFNSLGYLLSGLIASLFKPGERQQKEVKKNKLIVLFQDHMVVIFIFTFVLFMIASLFVPKGSIENMFAGQHFIIVSLIQATWFAAGCYIVLAGVRMMLAEIVPAFKGIADRIVPGAIPALDCPVLFSYAPLAAVTGFLLSFIGGLLAMAMMMQLQYTVIIPGVIPNFFSGGAAGVIAYKIGGRKGLVVASIIHGFVLTLLPVFLVPLLSNIGYLRTTFADIDYSAVGIIVNAVLDWFQHF
ncbi:PTS ascorbate transporter subunit IIC [Paenibacillus sp. GXUN7292]|uniref:PTS ascorbate transporter subunit IIC n=1 Tax=Paenibacillus sp. GXUN7292 TaxID=3422499 RepID=UPI003D7E779D